MADDADRNQLLKSFVQNEPPHLSVVATSRNDNHGKNLLYRMQHFVDGFIHQCKKHDLKAELILVEWNPPDDTLPLSQALHFPKDKGPCQIRIIRVPKEAHLKLKHSDKISLFQMIGKNVGIRRARGRFILATNIDILFSDNLFKFLKRKLKKECLYRVDRLDVPGQLPFYDSFCEILHYCSKNFFRINGKSGTRNIIKTSIIQQVYRRLQFFYKFSHLLLKKAIYAPYITLRKLLNLSLMSLIKKIIILSKHFSIFFLKKAKKHVKKTVSFLLSLSSMRLHTNACGDFTLLSAENWVLLRGYPEWPMYSWHLDSVLLYQARQHGIKEHDLPRQLPIYHIEHEIGSGYSPEGADLLFQRLEAKGIPYLSDSDLKELVVQMKAASEKIVYNDTDWGLADLSLEEWIV